MDLITLYLFIVGLFFGSFYNVVALRRVKNESIVFPASHCVNCNHKLAFYELIPVFSYLFLKGKCKKCKKKISLQYPLIELITGILFSLSYYIFGFDYYTLISIVVVSVAIITYITDIKEMIILDEVLLVGEILIFLIMLIFAGVKEAFIHLGYGLILFLIMLLIKILGDRIFKVESLGWGDIKLSILAGTILGPYLGVVYIFFGSFLALPYALVSTFKNKDHVIPFGPFLVSSMLLIFWNMDFVLNILDIILGGK